jgi:hypothetical protein
VSVAPVMPAARWSSCAVRSMGDAARSAAPAIVANRHKP